MALSLVISLCVGLAFAQKDANAVVGIASSTFARGKQGVTLRSGRALQATCVRNTNCAVNPWCNQTTFDSWCPLQGTSCPSPQCLISGATTVAPATTVVTTKATTLSSTVAKTTAKAVTTTTVKAAATTTKTATTTKAAATTTRAASTTTLKAGGGCVRNTDCAANAWCNDATYDSWCPLQGASCPAPQCVWSGSPPPTTAAAVTTVGPSTTAGSTTAAGPTTTVVTSSGALGSACPGVPTSALASWFTAADFANFFPNINDAACTGKNFFTYCALVEAAASFPTFCNSGNVTKDKLELAAFLGQTSHETTGGWATAPGGPQAWGYCFKEEVGCGMGQCAGYCAAGDPCLSQWGFSCVCAAGQTYHGRGPIQLSWNYNYGYFSKAFYGNASFLLQNPSLLTKDPVAAFQSGIWFWMTAQPPKPSCHDVITGVWTPTAADLAAGRVPGYGTVTNIINGGLECGFATGAKVTDRVEYFKRYLGILGVATPSASTLYCDQMKHF